MRAPRFNDLKERLLHAGIAPKHVRRYVAELEDHFDDLLREETARGLDQSTAWNAARTRLGGDDALAQTMLDRPELQSLAGRYPWAVVGLGPMVALALSMIATVLIDGSVINLFFSEPQEIPTWVKAAFDAWHGLVMYVVPLAIAALVCVTALNQRTPVGWLLLGMGLVIIFGSFHEVGLVWPEGDQKGRLIFGIGVAPQTLDQRTIRLIVNVTLAGTLYWLWRRRETAAD